MTLPTVPRAILKVTAALVVAVTSVSLSLLLPVVTPPELSQRAAADIGNPNSRALFDRVSGNTVRGESLTVCTDVYTNATRQAVNMWNSGLRGRAFVEFDVFTFSSTCPSVTAESTTSVDHIFVRGLSRTGSPGEWKCPRESGGCALVNTQLGPNNSYVGIVQIQLDTGGFLPAHEDPSDPGYTLDGFELNRAAVAHELGHTLSMPHPQLSACDDALMLCGYPLRDNDYESFGYIYKPNVPVPYPGRAPAQELMGQPGKVRVSLDPTRVRVANSIDLRLWNAGDGTWGKLLGSFSGALLRVPFTVDLTGQPAGPKTYGTFSTTEAYLIGQESLAGSGWIGFLGRLSTIGCRLTTTAGSGGTISPASGPRPCTDAVVVTATPDTGHHIDEWSGTDAASCADGAEACLVRMDDDDRSVHVTFERNPYTLTISAGSDGTTNPAPGEHTYLYGDRVIVTASPDAGYRVSAWSGACSGSGTSCTLTMDADKTASVTFEVRPVCTMRTLAVSAGSNGTTTPAPGRHSYCDDDEVTVTADPDAGYQVDAWSGACSGDGTSCTLTMDADKTASVTFERVYTLTVSAGSNGTTSPAPGAHTYGDGDSVTVTASPDSGYRVSAWSGACSGSGTSCTLTMDADKTASVTFEVRPVCTMRTLEVSAGSNGTTTPAPGRHSYCDDDEVTVTADPDAGYQVDAWGDDCSGDGSSCTLTMDANKTASVTFERVYTLTVSAGSNGTTSPAPGAHTYGDGDGATVTAIPDTNYRVDEWGGDCSGSGTSCTLTMDADKTASVTFEECTPRTLTVSAGSNGRTSPASGTHDYCNGESVTVTATPDTNYKVDAWGGACSGSGTSCTLTMDADKTASVTFVRTYTLTVSAGSNGTTSPAPGTHTYCDGDSVTVTAIPNAGYKVGAWGGDCSGSGTTCTLTMDANMTASVSFVALETFTLTVNVSGGGSASGAGTYEEGSSATVTATDTADWAFTHWEGDISSRARSVTFTMDEDKTVTAVFVFECDVVGCKRDADGADGEPAAPGGAGVRLADDVFTVNWGRGERGGTLPCPVSQRSGERLDRPGGRGCDGHARDVEARQHRVRGDVHVPGGGARRREGERGCVGTGRDAGRGHDRLCAAAHLRIVGLRVHYRGGERRGDRGG